MSTLTESSRLRRAWLFVTASALAFVALAWPTAASADQHRARMTREVIEHLRQNESKTIDVLVAVPQSVIGRLVRDYGVIVRQIIEGAGTVITVRPSQLGRLANDLQITDIAVDAIVYGQMALTN
jgi:hypothetical protein